MLTRIRHLPAFPLQFISMFQVSNRKTALRNRKKSKKLPMGESRLKELKNIKTMKEIQLEQEIRERLQHKTDINRHSKEVVEELFFPDVKYSNPDVLNRSFVQEEELKYQGGIETQLKSRLNSELLDTFDRNRDQFQPQNYKNMLHQMNNNCANLPQIKKRLVQKWTKYQKTLKRKGNFESVPFPYKFLDQKDISNHPIWKQVLAELAFRMLKSTSEEVWNYIYICQLTKKLMGFTPQVLFQALVSRSLALIKEKEQPTEVNVFMLRLCLLRQSVKLERKVVVSQELELKSKEQELINSILPLLVRVKKLKAKTIVRILQSLVYFKNINDRESLLRKLQSRVIFRLPELDFKTVYTILVMYLEKGLLKPKTLQLFKFDLYRKAPTATLVDTINVISIIQKGKIMDTDIEGESLLGACTDRIIDSLKSHSLSPPQLINILQRMYNNSYQNPAFYDLVSNQIVRSNSHLSLEEYLHNFCLLTVLDVRSVFLRDSALERVMKQYKTLRRNYKEQRLQFLPTPRQGRSHRRQSKSQQQPQQPLQSQPTADQIKLGQEMIKFLWAYLKQSKDESVNINQILQNFPPLQYVAVHPLLQQMVKYINGRLNTFSLFPKLKSGQIQAQNYPNLQCFYDRKRTPVGELLRMEAELAQNFILNINVGDGPSIKELWSQSGVTQTDYLGWLSKSNTDHLFFNGGKVDKRKKTFKDLKNSKLALIDKAPVKEGQTPQGTSAPIEYYQISEEQQPI